jgi:hypothetical protein
MACSHNITHPATIKLDFLQNLTPKQRKLQFISKKHAVFNIKHDDAHQYHHIFTDSLHKFLRCGLLSIFHNAKPNTHSFQKPTHLAATQWQPGDE